jgi:hypothetical protein
MRRIVITGLLVALTMGIGCIRLGGPDEVGRHLSREAGVDLQQEIGLTVTRSGVWLAKKSMKWADDEDMEFSLKGLRRVEVGVYAVKGVRDGGRESLGIHLFPTAWEPWIKIQEDDSEVFVLVKQGDTPEQIRGMLVVVAEDEEWVVVRMHGKLEQIIESTLRMAFDQTDRPELYAKTREERDLPPAGTRPRSTDQS